MASTATGSNPTLDTNQTRDSYIPLFSGQHSDYKEWRKRIKIYMMRMTMTKRGHEAILNLIGSLTGVAWKVAEAYDLEDLEKKPADQHFDKLLKLLDAAFEYDSRVQLPADFDRYFVSLQRKPGQTLLQYVTEHDECLRRLSDHKIDLRKAVQGWHLLRKAGLTREQKQLIMTQAPTLERVKVQEAMFLVLGQDHKHAVSGSSSSLQRILEKGVATRLWTMRWLTRSRWMTRPLLTRLFYEGSWDDYYEDDGSLGRRRRSTTKNDGALSFDDGASYYQQLEETAPGHAVHPRSTMRRTPRMWMRGRGSTTSSCLGGYLPIAIVALTDSAKQTFRLA